MESVVGFGGEEAFRAVVESGPASAAVRRRFFAAEFSRSTASVSGSSSQVCPCALSLLVSALSPVSISLFLSSRRRRRRDAAREELDLRWSVPGSMVAGSTVSGRERLRSAAVRVHSTAVVAVVLAPRRTPPQALEIQSTPTRLLLRV